MSFLDDRAGLSGRVAAVIGGGSGIGAAVSLALARAQGANDFAVFATMGVSSFSSGALLSLIHI